MRRIVSVLFLLSPFLLGIPSAQGQVKFFETHYDNGQPETIWFDLGHDRLQVLRFHENGLLKELGHWDNGKMHGAWALWAPNGRKIGEAEYLHGTKDGLWRTWDTQGNPQYELWYERNELVRTASLEP